MNNDVTQDLTFWRFSLWLAIVPATLQCMQVDGEKYRRYDTGWHKNSSWFALVAYEGHIVLCKVCIWIVKSYTWLSTIHTSMCGCIKTKGFLLNSTNIKIDTISYWKGRVLFLCIGARGYVWGSVLMGLMLMS